MAHKPGPLATTSLSTLLVALAAVAAAAPPAWRPNGIGANSAKVMRTPPLDFDPLAPRDTVILSTPIAAPVAVTASGEVVSLGEDGVLERTGANGHARWDLLLAPSNGAPALGENDTCFVASRDEQLYAVDSIGRLRWTRVLGARPRGGVIVAGGVVILALESGQVRWYAARDGVGIAEVALDAVPSAGPARLLGHAIIVPTAKGEVIKLDRRGVIWRAQLGRGAVGPVALDGRGASYAVTSDGAVACVAADGALAWRTAVDEVLTRSPALSADDVVYVATRRGLVALDARTGRRRWSTQLAEQIVGGPLVADDGSVYVSAVVDAAAPRGRSWPTGVALGVGRDGAVTTTIPLPTLPVAGLTLSDHRLWVGLRDATLVRTPVAPAGLAAGSPWPKERGDLRNSGAETP